jgi:hypothetical protein
MVDLSCWEESSDALGTPEPEREPLGNDLEGGVRRCADEAELDPLSSFCARLPSEASPLASDDDELDELHPLRELLDRELDYLPRPDYMRGHPHFKPNTRRELVTWMTSVRTNTTL